VEKKFEQFQAGLMRSVMDVKRKTAKTKSGRTLIMPTLGV
jgi:hypothetical protein